MKKDVLIKILVEVSRIILGATFIFSGFVKAVDPFGTAYKIEDYFTAFGVPSLSFLAFPLSALLCGGEFVLGACVLFGLYRKWNSRIMLVVMVFMTLLTLYLAIANPVDDCGCFGDAFVITNWQTFYKNIVLLVCAVCIFVYHERIANFFTGKTYWLAFMYIILFIGLFIFRNYIYEPLFDFRPYKIGASIPEGMTVEEGKGSQVENYFVYTKDGVEKEFTEDNYPWQDSTWVFVRMDEKVIKEGEEPKIKDFSVNQLIFNQDKTDLEAEIDITQEILTDTGYVFLMISPSLLDMDMTHLSNFEDVESYANEYEHKYGFYCLTASTTDEIMRWAKENTINFNFCSVDGRVLKTITRSNPGLILLKDGVVVNKWADIDVPAEEDLDRPLPELPYGQMIDTAKEDKKNIFYVSAVFVLPLLFLKGMDFVLYRRRKKVAENDDEKDIE